MSEHVLVTGASGFLGYHIVNAALGQGLTVYAAVRKNSNTGHLIDLPIQYLFLDYDDPDDLVKQLGENKIAYIIHAAGITRALKPESYNYINATYTLNLAKAAEKLPDSFKKMVFISSLAAVGPLVDEIGEITEATVPKPLTAYGRSKLLAEKNLATVKIPCTILRPTVTYGPREKEVFIAIKNVKRGLDPQIGRFLQRLSFVHAKDVADVAVKALFINNALGIYNITDGNSYNWNQFSDITKIILKTKAFRMRIPMPVVRILTFFIETTYGWLKKPALINREKLHELSAKNWICDISKAEKELAFAPKFDLQAGLEDSIAWYTKNKWI